MGWSVLGEDGSWMLFTAEANEVLERAYARDATTCEVRVHTFFYDIDLKKMVQRNRKTMKERHIQRCEQQLAACPSDPGSGKVSVQDLDAAIKFYIDLETLPAANGHACDDGPLPAANGHVCDD